MEQKYLLFIFNKQFICIVTRRQEEYFFLGRGRRFFWFPNIQNDPGTHPILLFNGYWGIFLWG